GLRAGVGRVRRGTLDRVGGDPSRGRARRDGARGGPRRARRRSPLRVPRRRAGMTVLVTGASGLVGSHVVQALVSRGERVRALVRPPSREAVVRLGAEAVAGDVTDAAAWQSAARGVGAIVHAAAVVRQAAERREIDAVALRPNVIYGERDRLFTPRVIRVLRLPLVPRIGAGTNRLACVYAGNVAAAALAALAAGKRGFHAYNVTS